MRISLSAPNASFARPALAQTLMNALHTAALGTFEPGTPSPSTSVARMDPARSTASSPDQDPAATPRASVVSKLDTAWLFAPIPASDARRYTSRAHLTFSALLVPPSFAAADSAAPYVLSVGVMSSLASTSAKTSCAARRSPARAAAVMSELYVRTLAAHWPASRMASTVPFASSYRPIRAQASTYAFITAWSHAPSVTARRSAASALRKSPHLPAAEMRPL